MDQRFFPIFAFKRLFGEQVPYSLLNGLQSHPLIWKVLSEEVVFDHLERKLEGNPSNWKVASIIKEIAVYTGSGEYEDKDPAMGGLREEISQISIISQIIEEILNLVKNDTSWEMVIEKLTKSAEEYNLKKNDLGVIITAIPGEIKEVKGLENALIDHSEKRAFLLGYLIFDRELADNVGLFFERNQEKFSEKPAIVLEIVSTLFELGVEAEANRLANLYLTYKKCEEEKLNDHNIENPDETFNLLKQYDDAMKLAQLVGDLGIFCDRELGRYQSVQTHPDFRKRGIAGNLVYQAGVYAYENHDVERLVIVAEADSPAQRLYHSIGFQFTEYQMGIWKADIGTD